MKGKKRLILIALVILELILVSALIFTVFFSSEKELDEKTTPEPILDSFLEDGEEVLREEVTETEKEKEEENIEYALRESAWLPPWYFTESFDSLKDHEGIIDIVNPVFYSANSNGTLLDRKPTESDVESFLEYCIQNEISVIPTVGSYSYDVTDSIFINESSYKKHIENIVTEVDKYNYDGIDIDYEQIRREKKDKYINFLRELSVELKERGKTLSVTVFAQWGDNITYENHSDTIYAQDLKLIGDIADQVRVMAYDYTLQSSPTPGPIGPIDWMEEVLEYTLLKIPKEKVWLGVHLYGYRWKDGEATALTPASFEAIVSNPSINTEFKEDIAEGYAQYGCSGTTCYLYYQTKRGVNLRRELASEYQISGVSYWSLGRDDGLLLTQ